MTLKHILFLHQRYKWLLSPSCPTQQPRPQTDIHSHIPKVDGQTLASEKDIKVHGNCRHNIQSLLTVSKLQDT